ncbi:TetR/AcrR family transcriptional regulator [Oceanicoccus sp. KOV_DT_Chl]|uniref:TetR/AcrR family transcriptional regulator n=1 Tax=Oceanicoccus sp. KOV_DT_Chl TaxID=1904639 RepID=UPI000C7A3DAA|nr:TetR/AcrR family transcriptional regulator [Oceanicoccus sp. KOV_DT_Chl]
MNTLSQTTAANTPAAPSDFSATAIELITAAERLLAEKGLGAVSTREIARAAGQKNHSALNYHFGCREGLINAILDYRMTPLNLERQQLLDTLSSEQRDANLYCLVEALVTPFANELTKPIRESYYLSLLAQLMSQREWQLLFTQHQHRSSAAIAIGAKLIELLTPVLGAEIAMERIRLLGLHLLNTITEWDAMRRRGELVMDDANLEWRVKNLITYLTGALTANVEASKI